MRRTSDEPTWSSGRVTRARSRGTSTELHQDDPAEEMLVGVGVDTQVAGLASGPAVIREQLAQPHRWT